jgi:ABC-type transporter Mla subunit MlaD
MKILVLIVLLVPVASCKKMQPDFFILFDRTDNISKGSEVKMNGLVIGEVASLKLLDNGVVAGIRLHKKIKISSTSGFSILSPLLGNASISIDPRPSTQYLSTKDTVAGYYVQQKPLDHLFSDTVARKKIQTSLDKIAEGLKELIEARTPPNNRRAY